MAILNSFAIFLASPPSKSTLLALFTLGVVISLSTSLANVSLKYNSVGFYQMAKIAVTPSIVLAEFIWYKKKVTFSKVLVNIIECFLISTNGLQMILPRFVHLSSYNYVHLSSYQAFLQAYNIELIITLMQAAGQDYENENLTKGIEVSWCYLYRNKRSTEFLGIEVAVSNCISFYVLQHQYQCPSS
ncbi:hypothetical protein PVK06_043118 [Gossypium arboreum]|uniref:Uncharacterized protein n=1 Tax=Gossypium arboreum TaxID=29729 RepID=A0ABR0MML5_GOSAR|nr:hypothetical protein PVK06_043118 [Gossypium arboreum]